MMFHPHLRDLFVGVLIPVILFDAAQSSPIACPILDENPIELLVPPSNITIQKSTDSTLCLLVHIKHISSTSEVFITNNSPGSDYFLSPIARSYDGNDWEKTPGPYKDVFAVVDDCQDSGGEWCQVTFDKSVNGKFFLMTFAQSPSSFDQQLSRFFQQTTFGPTKSMIDNWAYDKNESGMVQWLQSQIAVPPTKHREYFRKYTDTISYNNTVGDTLTWVQHPCSPYSRWRKYAFPSYASFQQFDVVPHNDNQFLILMFGIPVTIVDSFSSVADDGLAPVFSGAGQYQFCWVVVDAIGGYIQFRQRGSDIDCHELDGGNPAIILTQTVIDDLGHQLRFIDLPDESNFEESHPIIPLNM